MSEVQIMTAVYIKDMQSGRVFAHKQDILLESSSTIKVIIIYLALLKSVTDNIPLETVFTIEQRHLSNGSGIINWTDWKRLSLADLITYVTMYSDCVATNVLIDFISGKDYINDFLAQKNIKTRLVMPMINFDQEAMMPEVGTTTAKEMTELFAFLLNTEWPKSYQQFIQAKLSRVHTSWFEEMMPKNNKLKLLHKTGSMINVGPRGDTVFNVTGRALYQNINCHFTLLSRTDFGAPATAEQLQQLKQYLVHCFTNGLCNVTNHAQLYTDN